MRRARRIRRLTIWSRRPSSIGIPRCGGQRHRALTLRLQGDGVHVSRDAAGARAYRERDDGLRLMQELCLGSSLGAGNDPALRFGWGEAGGAALASRWPTGAIQAVTPPASYTETLVIPYAPAAE